MSQPAPRRVGRYEVGPLLGQGGEGAVYRATLVGPGGFHKPVALKILTSPHASLHREARIGGLLRHQHLVDLFEVGRADGVSFCAMELCEGGALTDHLPLPPRAVVDVGLAVCSALRYAHEELGLIHRDLKPANLLLSAAGELKVADLGIAVAEGFGPDRSIRGTPQYMAPEQARGEPLDPRADLFALGVTLVELATGRANRADETLDFDVFDADPAPPSDPIPGWLAPAVDRCLQPDPADRWPDIAALEAALRALDAPGATLAATLGIEPEAAPRRPTHNLPATTTPLVGRQEALAELADALAEPGVVALVGSGGIGKSRLALEATRRWLDHSGGQAWCCDLSAVHDIDGVLGAVATAMGAPLTAVQALDQLGRMLAGRGPTVLLLDNVEHLREHASVVFTWLEAAPELRILVTSRISAGMVAHHTLQVPPLTHGQSTELLVALAEQRGVDLSTDPDLDELAQRLEGVPLALELAAGRLGVLTVRDVLTRLDAGILRSAKSGRHQTLRDTLAWSWEMLAPEDQRALTQLTAFAGDFSAESAEFVLDLPPGSNALDRLDTLVRHSVLRPVGMRFKVLRGLEELADGPDRDAARDRHAAWFARMGTEDFLAHLDRRGGHAQRLSLTSELENVVAALSHAVAEERPHQAVPLLVAAWATLRDQGPLERGLALASSVLQMTGLSPEERARAQYIASSTALVVGRMDEANAHLERALDAFRAHADPIGRADALSQMGELRWRQGALQQARDWYEQARDAAVAAGSKRREARVTGLLGVVCHHLGQLDEALAHQRASVRMFRELGAVRGEAVALGNLATLHHALGQTDEAREAYEATLRLVEEQGNRRVEGVALSNLGNLLQHLGQPEDAVRLYARALAIHRELGNPRSEGRTLGCLGMAVDDLAEREAHLTAAARLAVSTGDERQEGYWLLQLARGVGGERASDWLDRAERVLDGVGDPSFLAILHATRAQRRWDAGDPDGARAALAHAEHLAPDGDQESGWALDEARAHLGG